MDVAGCRGATGGHAGDLDTLKLVIGERKAASAVDQPVVVEHVAKASARGPGIRNRILVVRLPNQGRRQTLRADEPHGEARERDVDFSAENEARSKSLIIASLQTGEVAAIPAEAVDGVEEPERAPQRRRCCTGLGGGPFGIAAPDAEVAAEVPAGPIKG